MPRTYARKGPPLEDAAARYLEAAQLGGNVPRWLHQQGVILGDFLAHLAPQGLRHAFIRAAVQRANLRDVQLHAGHASIQTTEKYLGPDPRASGRVADAMGGLLPQLGKLAT